jgi:ribonuclease T1
MPEGRRTRPRPSRLLPILWLLALMVTGCALSIKVPLTQGPATSPVMTAPAAFDGGTVSVRDLPPEASETLRLIVQGGPFRHDQDGAVFQNREGLLPDHPRGYYHEYTVETPGSADRGARRIVTGQAGERYYTDDHYETFRFIVGDEGG